MSSMRTRNVGGLSGRGKVPIPAGHNYGEPTATRPRWLEYALGLPVYLGDELQRIRYYFCVNNGKHFDDTFIVTEGEKVYNICIDRLSIPDATKRAINDRAIADGHGLQLAIVKDAVLGKGKRKHARG